MHLTSHEFQASDLIGGHVVLDFLNTVTARDQPEPADGLGGYDALLDWAALTTRFTPGDLKALRAQAAREPALAGKALTQTRALREELHAAVNLALKGRALPDELVDSLKAQWKQALDHAVYGTRHGHWAIAHSAGQSGLKLIAHALAFDAMSYLRELDPARVRTCPGSHCGWMFVDTSKAGRRRWCDMATCGNVAKARRHQLRLSRAR